MNRVSLWFGGAALLALVSPAIGADPAKLSPPEPSPVATELTAKIDRALDSAWAERKITPAPSATDAEFLRRVYLDLAGRIPSVAEARAFLADTRADKRRQLVASLLNRPTYARHFATVWRHLLIPEADGDSQSQYLAPMFEQWLRQQFDKNVPFDKIVRDLLTTPVQRDTTQSLYNGNTRVSPVVFYLAKEGKPENLAAASARVFLGIRLECAQCHNHPFAAWTREQFWGLAAFFAGIRSQDAGDGFAIPEKELLDRREIVIPGTDRPIQATFPDGTEPQWKFKVGPRETLADWVIAKNNPYFAKAITNRVWAHLFGVGLVEPVDEMSGGQDTVVHHAELLDELAKAFVAAKYDLRFLIEAITASRAYQLSSRSRDKHAPLFSRHRLRGLTGEQLFDSLAVATGQPDQFATPIFLGQNTPRNEFLAKFGQQTGRPTEYETSIIQALTLMNGSFTEGATHPTRSELLTAVLEAPFLTDRGRIETLYLAALARKPTEKERDRALAFIAKATTDTESKNAHDEAIADLFWALINSAEFVFNH